MSEVHLFWSPDSLRAGISLVGQLAMLLGRQCMEECLPFHLAPTVYALHFTVPASGPRFSTRFRVPLSLSRTAFYPAPDQHCLPRTRQKQHTCFSNT